MYGTMQKGYTDAVCILGFADVVNPDNEDRVYRVHDVNTAFSEFIGDGTNESSLIQGMLEVYSTGCRDIYLYPIAPMSAYATGGDRDATWWSDLYDYYYAALEILADYDEIDVLIPYDADVEEGDFVQLFATHNTLIPSNILRITYFSYQGDEDTTFTGEDYSIVLVNGLATFHFPDHFTNDYTSGMAASFAGMVSTLEINVPPDNRLIKPGYMFSSDYDGVEETLEQHHIVGFRKTVGYKRVSDGSLVSTLSYTRAGINSDFRMLFVVHLIQRFLRGINRLDLIGSPSFLAQDVLKEYFSNWVRWGYVESIESSFKLEGYTLNVGVVISLPMPIGTITTEFVVGPVY
jgi:hypothetical protein